MLLFSGTCITSSVGQEFVLMFMENNNPDRDVELFITTSDPSGAFVTITSPGWINPPVNERIRVFFQQLSRVVINKNLIALGNELSTKGIKVTSSAGISVTAFHRQGSSCDGFTVFPVNALGNAYMAVTVPLNAQIGIVSPGNNIIVEVTFPNVASLSIYIEGTRYGPGSTFRTGLDEYESLQIQDTSGADLTGTLVRSSQPIALFSGNSNTYMGSSSFMDHTVEQLPPVSTWGSDFIVVPTPNTDTGGNIKIVAAEANTNIQIFTTPIIQKTLYSAGDNFEFEFDRNEYVRVTSTGPILVVQLSRSGGSSPSEPALTVIPPRNQYLSSYSLSVPPIETGLFQNYLFLIATFNQIPSIFVDGRPVGSADWAPITSTTDGTTVKRLTVTPGPHSIRNINKGLVGAYQYGFVDTGCSYLYLSGQCLDTINSVVGSNFNV